ncbi:hypothetical protein DFQ27_002407 [Actinomortierella ambigua]|uniref:Metal homeostatis protein bsd2 n=1 Tax=Actinomortierella ambigua TaxID=1343610 RepID=A0A9P6UCS4_9FUNG|nr:hypothetical protein DFQ27_002407 [Actinomortierella ambigua]
MSRHTYAQIPVSEAHDDDHSASSFSPLQVPQQQQQGQQQQLEHQQQPTSTSSSSPSRRANGYSALQIDEDDEDEHDHDEHDAFLGQSHPLASPSASSSGHHRRLDNEISLAPPLPSSSTPASGSRASTPSSSRRVIGSGNDGVFANLSAKPRVEKLATEELPPPYKQAALDATPAYYETTVNTPDYLDDDVLVEGLPVGNIYGFVWNFVVSMSFQFVGFFLTYLLHTSHSTKNGSKAGLGVTFITMGIQMMNGNAPNEDQDADTGYMYRAGQSLRAMTEYIWLSYIMLILGTFLLLRSFYDFARVMRMESIINATSSQARNVSGNSETTPRRSSDDDPAAVTLAYIDLEAGFAATRLNNASNESNDNGASSLSAASASLPSSTSTSTAGNETSPTAPTEGNVRRDHVITLLA